MNERGWLGSRSRRSPASRPLAVSRQRERIMHHATGTDAMQSCRISLDSLVKQVPDSQDVGSGTAQERRASLTPPTGAVGGAEAH